MKLKALFSVLALMSISSPAFSFYGNINKCNLQQGGMLIETQKITVRGFSEDIGVGYYPQGESNPSDNSVSGHFKLVSWNAQTNIMVYQPIEKTAVSSLVRHIGRSDQIYEFHLADGTVQTLQCVPSR
jgi:hypothetical protein